MIVYTSICMNYLPKALILAKSLKKYNTNVKFYVILVEREIPDDWPDVADELIDEVILAKDLGFKNFDKFIFKHSIVEASTSIKGQALVYLLDKDEKVTYIDPDIQTYKSLNELSDILNEEDIVLTPHLTIPEIDEKDIVHNELSALRHGIYNLGFLAVKRSEEGLKFAKWWRDRLNLYCYDDIPKGIFTDQRWVDLAPAYFNVYILKDPGYNMAPWNLSTRKLKLIDEKLIVNGEYELVFFHYSGFDSGANEKVFNRYVKDKSDYIYVLRNNYIKEMNYYGQKELGNHTWSYDFYFDGKKINNKTRLLYRDNKLENKISHNPFELSDSEIKGILNVDEKPKSSKKKLKNKKSIKHNAFLSKIKKFVPNPIKNKIKKLLNF